MLSVYLSRLVSAVLNLLTLMIIVRALLTWIPNVDHDHPLVRTITRVTDPLLRPVRRLVPLFDGMDLSPLVALAILWLIGLVVIQFLAGMHF